MEHINNLGGWAIAPEVYNWIRKNIKNGSTILELGSGTGTSELSKYYKMHSIEHDENFVGKYDSTYIHAPIKQYDGYRWYDVDILEEKLPIEYDLLLIDGPPGGIGRIGVVHNIDLFNTDIPIIVDDTNRKPESDLFHKLKNILGKGDIEIVGSHNKESMIIL